jgi:hypothetical protein
LRKAEACIHQNGLLFVAQFQARRTKKIRRKSRYRKSPVSGSGGASFKGIHAAIARI